MIELPIANAILLELPTNLKDTRVLDSVQATCIDGTTVERLQRLGRMADPVHGHQERSLHRWLRDLFGHSLEPYNVTFRLQRIENRVLHTK